MSRFLWFRKDKMVTYQAPTSNFLSTTLNGSINDSVDTITLTSTTGLQEPGVIVIDREDGNGTATPNSREVVAYTAVSGNDLTGCTRGAENSTARSHSSGALVETMMTVGQWNDLVDSYQVAHEDTGVHKASLALTTPKITTSINDSAGNEVIKTPATGSAVNEITVTNAAANGSPSITATGGDTNINLLASGKGTGLFIPQIPLAEGQMLNGKLSVSVASNNLTVALKTNSGADPSAASPVYVMIGGVLRSVTAALTYTLPAGGASFKAGSAELATKAIDYFAYLVWKASDSSWIIGWSRIPYATVYSDFSATQDDANYLARNATPAAGDVAVLIGRFEATLSAGAGYTWSVPTFTATNLIQRPIYDSRPNLDFVSTLTSAGGNLNDATITKDFSYQIRGRKVSFKGRITMTNKGTGLPTGAIKCTAPFTTLEEYYEMGTSLETAATNTLGCATIDAANGVSLMKYDGTTWIVNGYRPGFSIEYEI